MESLRIDNDFLFKPIRLEHFYVWLDISDQNRHCNNIVDFEYKRFCDTYKVNIGKLMFTYIMCVMNGENELYKIEELYKYCYHIPNVFEHIFTYKNLHLPYEFNQFSELLYDYYSLLLDFVINNTNTADLMKSFASRLFHKIKDYISISAMRYPNTVEKFNIYIDNRKINITNKTFLEYIVT